MSQVPRAIISVYDKTGVVELGRSLVNLGYEVVSTGGTYRCLKEAGLPVTYISEVTGFPEILDGRVKTLHPAIHAGILAKRREAGHMSELEARQIKPVDLVAVNLYPFTAVAARPEATLDEVLENIDIGGPTLIRAAAKNFPDVIVVVNPERYGEILAALQAGGLDPAQRRSLAAEAFAHTAAYDAAITGYLQTAGLQSDGFPTSLTLHFQLQQEMRYGENPHQKAAFYRSLWEEGRKDTLVHAVQLNGKELSYNNIGDASAALEMVREFAQPAVAAVKHANPCGLAVGATLKEAFIKARDADPVSIFGGVVACNRAVDEETAKLMAEIFLEIVLAPSFTPAALEILCRKPSLRLLQLPVGAPQPWLDMKRVPGGLLVQEADVHAQERSAWQVVTKKVPTAAEWEDLAFGWQVVKHVKSNAIVVVRDGQTVGVGAGQMSRIKAAEIALAQAGEKAVGAALASDAFFPFDDVVNAAAAAGVTAIIQPGGSKRDADSLAAADKAGIAMVFTGMRHFRH